MRRLLSSDRLPLIEAVISIVIFTILCVPIVKLYLTADSVCSEAVGTSRAMIVAENAAEMLHSCTVNAKEECYEVVSEDGSLITIPFEGGTSFLMGGMQVTCISSTAEGSGSALLSAVISVRGYDAEEKYISLRTAVRVPLEKEAPHE